MSPEPPAQPDRKGIDRELRRGSLELAILHLLSSGEAYGYEIVSKLTAETNGALEVADGTLYPVLYRLERAGFVDVRWETPPDRRGLDVRTIVPGQFTPKDKFATTQHYGHPDVDPATFKLKISGLVNTPKQLSLDDLKKLGSTDLIAGFECSGNRGPLNQLSGNGKWTGVYTDTQADRGEREYGRTCAHCHGLSLEGDGSREIPALVLDSFMRHWRGRPVQALFDTLMRSMPADDRVGAVRSIIPQRRRSAAFIPGGSRR